jgi:serine-threonine kinase receptor-associated protein
MLRQGDTGDWVGTYEGHKGAVWGACLSRDATKAATGAADFTVKLWNAQTGDEIQTFSHKHIVKVVDFSHDSCYLLSGCNDKQLRVFDLGRPDSAPRQLEGSRSAVKSAVWTREPGMLVSCCEDQDLTLWDSRTGGVAKTLALESPATSIELSQDRELLTVAHGAKVTIVNASSFEKVKTLSVPLCYSASLHPSGKWLVTGGEDFKLYKFDYEEEKEVESSKGHFGPVHCVRYSPDGEVYCSGSEDGTIRLWQHVVGKSYGLWRSAEEVAARNEVATRNNSNHTAAAL